MVAAFLDHSHSRFPTSGHVIFIVSLVLVGCLGCQHSLRGSAVGGGPDAQEYDVVVYGGTAGGAVAAVAASDEGAAVVLLEPGNHIGGMVSGGLGRTDFGRKETIGGMSRGFFERVGKHYGEPITWYFEPHVAERVFRDWLNEAGVDVRFGHRIDRVEKDGAKIDRIIMENGAGFRARIYIDAGYEGDLMARADVSYTWGREGQEVYGESLAGVREKTPKHQFHVDVSPYDENGDLLPLVYGGDPGQPGQGDRKVQAYNFRICMCSRPENQVPWPRPADYDPARYELLKRYLAAARPEHITEIIHIGHMPNDKTDVNNNGAISTDHIGGSWDYPDADYATRQRIWDDHVSYVQGFFYFIANDPSVPKHLRDEMNAWGPAKDEFVDTGHWPHQLYIREARRMIGAYVMKQSDLQDNRTKPDSIGMGSYNSDSHNVQRIPTPEGTVMNEGDMQVPVRPYEIAYRALTPKQGECSNLLVVGCVSASHVAYSSIRMEPVYMIMGHTAGVAAASCAERETAVQEIDVNWLRNRLREQEQILSLDDVPAPHVDSRNLPGTVVDDRDAVVVGAWHTSTSCAPFVDRAYLHDNNEGKGEKRARFIARLPAGGLYEVRVAYTSNPNRATNVPVRIAGAGATEEVHLNQRQAPQEPPWISVGTFEFRGLSRNDWVEIGTADTEGHVVVDAVQWIPSAHSRQAEGD